MRLFVYGTLRRGGSASHLLRDGRWIGPARLRGTLHDVDGRFPALVLEGAGEVRGEVWNGPEDLLPALDRYEGVEQGLFRRVRVELDEEPCWVYVAGPRLAPRLGPATALPDGEWRGGR